MVKEEVGPDDVADVVAAWTGIPAGRLLEGETAKLLRMEEGSGERLIGQTEAVRRSPTRCAAPAPASPTRTGRPARSCSSARPASARPSWPRRWRTSCSTTSTRWSASTCREYGEKHSVARLVGAPPGYVGYEEGGQLTEAVRRRPYSVVLLDEVEKAHPEVFDVLLQVLDDGRLTDGQGRTVDFRNTILILTSNLGPPVRPPVDEALDPGRPSWTGASGGERGAGGVQAGVPEPAGRHVIFDPLGTDRTRPDRRPPGRASWPRAWPTAG